MQFALNWSPEAAQLLRDGAIMIDLFKCPDWDDLVADAQAQRASYVHFPLQIGTAQHESWDFVAIEAWLARTDTRFVNCHIMPMTAYHPADIALDDLIPRLIAEVQRLVDAFGAERVIIENCPIFEFNQPLGYMRQAAEPAMFQQIIAATGCGFLLDMAHVVMTTDYLGWDFEATICAMPTDRIREFHITGIGRWSNGVIGDHMAMTQADWERLQFCLDQMASGAWRIPQVIAFEYGGIGKLKELCGSDASVIEVQVPRLYQMVHQLQPTL